MFQPLNPSARHGAGDDEPSAGPPAGPPGQPQGRQCC